MTFFIGLFFGSFAIGGAVWYFFFLAHANPPLPRADVTVQRADGTPNTNVSSAISTSTSDTTSPSTNPTSSYERESLRVDGATFNVEIASTMMQQARGLSYRTSLGANDGMLFIFSSGGVQHFWMKDMNFPLDMIWISGNTVVGFAENAAAEPGVAFPTKIYSSPDNTDKVLEVNAGTVAKYHIKAGDVVTIEPLQ